jgi:hypothetical protein
MWSIEAKVVVIAQQWGVAKNFASPSLLATPLPGSPARISSKNAVDVQFELRIARYRISCASSHTGETLMTVCGVRI